MTKIRILAIAPYEGMKQRIESVARRREDVDVSVFVGDLAEGVSIVQSLAKEAFDIVISRGGTAKLIRKATPMPVVEIGISAFDILRAIRLAEVCTDRYAIVGYRSITSCAEVLCSLMQLDVPIVTIDENTDVPECLLSLQQEGISLILCDMISSVVAAQINLNSILLASGDESILEALDGAVNLFHSFSNIRFEADAYRAIIANAPCAAFIFREGRLAHAFSPLPQEEEAALAAYIEKRLPGLSKYDEQTAEAKWNQRQLSIHSRRIDAAGGSMRAVYVSLSTTNPYFDDRSVIIYDRASQPNGPLPDNRFQDLSFTAASRQLLDTYAPSHSPVMIMGETGTGKNAAADYLYENGPYRSSPYYIIDCRLINEKRWNGLMEHHGSPFQKSGVTIHLKNIGMLGGQQTASLISLISHARLCNRNRLIFSATADERALSHPLYSHICNNRLCLMLNLPNMRSHGEDIPAFANLCLARLNPELGKQLIGFEPEALSLLQGFHWPRNFDQFHRVLRELAVLTDTPYIRAATVQTALNQEYPYQLARQEHGHAILNLRQTLENIEYDVIRVVLSEEGMNHSKAAERLGISRTTIWRLMKAKGDPGNGQ